MDYVSKYLQADDRANTAESKLEEYRNRVESNRWEQCRLAWEATATDSPSKAFSQTGFAAEVGKSPTTIKRQSTVWAIYGDSSPATRPPYAEAYSEAMGTTSAAEDKRKRLVDARRVLSDPKLAAELPAGALVEAIRNNPDAARAIARNQQVRDAIEDEVTEQRTSQHEDNVRDWTEKRNRFEGKVAKALEMNNAVEAMRTAVGAIGEAIFAQEEWGVEGYEDEWTDMIKRAEHLLKVAKSSSKITQDDSEFLASIGIEAP